jgi:hypothetical protein
VAAGGELEAARGVWAAGEPHGDADGPEGLADEEAEAATAAVAVGPEVHAEEVAGAGELAAGVRWGALWLRKIAGAGEAPAAASGAGVRAFGRAGRAAGAVAWGLGGGWPRPERRRGGATGGGVCSGMRHYGRAFHCRCGCCPGAAHA